MQSIFLRLLLGVLSCGWLLPLMGAGRNLLQYLNDDLPSVLLKGGSVGAIGMAQMPTIAQAMDMLYLAMGWLAVVIVVWSFVVSRRRRSGTNFTEWTRRLSEKEALLDRQIESLIQHLDTHKVALDGQVAAVGASTDRLNGSVSHRLSLLDERVNALGEGVLAKFDSLGDQIGTLARSAQAQRSSEREVIQRTIDEASQIQAEQLAGLTGRLEQWIASATEAASMPVSTVVSSAAESEVLGEELKALTSRLAHLESMLKQVHIVAASTSADVRSVRDAAQAGNASWFGELPVQGALTPSATEASRLRSVVLNLSVLQETLREQNRELRKRLQGLPEGAAPAKPAASTGSTAPHLPRAA